MLIIAPTLSFLMQLIENIAYIVIKSHRFSFEIILVIVFQLIVIIWVGVQSEYLCDKKTEAYLRTFNIKTSTIFLVELCFSFVILLPFILLLMLGVFSTLSTQNIETSIISFIYFSGCLCYIVTCLVKSQPLLIFLLLVLNLLFSYKVNFTMSSIVAVLPLVSVGFVITEKICYSKNKFGYFKLVNLAGSNRFPNVHLNLKGLLVWSKAFTTCIISLVMMCLAIFVVYSIHNLHEHERIEMSFLTTSCLIAYLYGFFIYKIIEHRTKYGEFFMMFYNEKMTNLIDMYSIYSLFIITFIILSIMGCCVGLNILRLILYSILPLTFLLICIIVNKRFPSNGPITALLIGVVMNTICVQMIL